VAEMPILLLREGETHVNLPLIAVFPAAYGAGVITESGVKEMKRSGVSD
jgi:hypothetical protein